MKLEKSKLNLPSVADFVKSMMAQGMTRRQAKQAYNNIRRDDVYINETDQVNVDREPVHGFPFPVWHLSIKRRDKAPIHDWRILQALKNAVCGEQVEAIELYPAECRLGDTANQYHLFAFPEGQQVPCGWLERSVTDHPNLEGAVQRKRDRDSV
jgi:hypothetical protein